jgi:AcrR family transcriptional regulator
VTASPLDADTILAATEAVLRRHGPAKANVVDVARELGVSHGAVYRYFPSKAALREAVTRRWLGRSTARLAAIADDAAITPPQRLRAWSAAVLDVKRATVTSEPELFETYRALVGEQGGAAAEHVAELLAQLARILAAGMSDGSFAPADPAATAEVVFTSLDAFHHPAHADEWARPGTDARLDAVCTLVLAGLQV